jgi:hypothetical protein
MMESFHIIIPGQQCCRGEAFSREETLKKFSRATCAATNGHLTPVRALIIPESIRSVFVSAAAADNIRSRFINGISGSLRLSLFIARFAPQPDYRNHRQHQSKHNTSQSHHYPRLSCLVSVQIPGHLGKINCKQHERNRARFLTMQKQWKYQFVRGF